MKYCIKMFDGDEHIVPIEEEQVNTVLQKIEDQHFIRLGIAGRAINLFLNTQFIMSVEKVPEVKNVSRQN